MGPKLVYCVTVFTGFNCCRLRRCWRQAPLLQVRPQHRRRHRLQRRHQPPPLHLHQPRAPTPTTIPAADHVFLVLLENHGFNQVIGSASMPYLNSLATSHSLATNYFANTHPSIGNYFMLTTGNIETNNDAFTGTVSSDNIPRAFAAAGKTWKAYMESLPSVGLYRRRCVSILQAPQSVCLHDRRAEFERRDGEPGSVHSARFGPGCGRSAEFCLYRTQRGGRRA